MRLKLNANTIITLLAGVLTIIAAVLLALSFL